MKVIWFNLMPYRYLPEGFRDKYRSVWVDIPGTLYDPEKGHFLYNEYLDQLEFADRLGYDGIGVNEHHANAYGLMPSPNLMAAALARRTSKSALVVLGDSIALYNPPVRVAEELAMLDVISGGRLVAGFPVGTSMDSNYSYGVNPATMRERFYEAHDLIVKAWTSHEPFAFNGKYTQLRYVNAWPRPLQKPHPPVWVPGGGSVETWDWAVEHGYDYSYLSFFGHQRAKKLLDGFWEVVAKHGLDENPYRCGFAQLVCISDTDSKAEKEYAPHLNYFFNNCLHVYSGFADAPGYRTLKTIKAGILAQVGKEADLFRFNLSWKDLVEGGYIIAGSPATVRQRMIEVAKMLRVGRVFLLLHIGSMPHEMTMQNTELFAQHVLPALHELWSEWEDRTWPRPLARRATVPPAPVAA
jgi:alkanesulfonate monooxygenase SsuD/methylene tetrahydromethanopterin reductase-like flavin-dependent oxidoreductase (luciferase family)